jgi:hypothetical protein
MEGDDVPYPELFRFLMGQSEGDRIAVSLIALESLIGKELPVDAFLPSWWNNDRTTPHSRSWLDAGWEVEAMNPGRGVAFVRVPTAR